MISWFQVYVIDNYRDSRNRSNSSRDVVSLKRRNCYSSFEIKASSSFVRSVSFPSPSIFFSASLAGFLLNVIEEENPIPTDATPAGPLPADPASHNFHRGRCMNVRCMNVGRGEGGEEEEGDASAYIWLCAIPQPWNRADQVLGPDPAILRFSSNGISNLGREFQILCSAS